METIFDFMAKDHDRLDGFFLSFRQCVKEKNLTDLKPLFREFKTGLQRHIVWEEEVLFPAFESRTGMVGDGPTHVMRLEHRTFGDLLERIHSKVKLGELESIMPLAESLLAGLGDHNDKEETILYPWIDQEIGEEGRAELFKKMESIPSERYEICCGEMPKRKEASPSSPCGCSHEAVR